MERNHLKGDSFIPKKLTMKNVVNNIREYKKQAKEGLLPLVKIYVTEATGS